MRNAPQRPPSAELDAKATKNRRDAPSAGNSWNDCTNRYLGGLQLSNLTPTRLEYDLSTQAKICSYYLFEERYMKYFNVSRLSIVAWSAK